MRKAKPAVRGLSGIASRVAVAGLGAGLATWLLWSAMSVHLQRSCFVLDTPYLPLCPNTATDDPGRRQELRAHLRENPGDSSAWVALANIEEEAAQKALLPVVAALAPSEPDVLRLRAREALARKEMPLAVAVLVQMTDHRIAGAEPPQILARLIADGTGTDLLRPHLVAGSRWLPQVLAGITALKLPLEPALPLITEAAAKRIIAQDTVQSYVRALKAEGRWVDAYALWVAQQRQPVPLLFNGTFEQRFQPDGFDWEVTPVPTKRAGALVTQRNMPGHGTVLEVQYTGRAVATPVIRQYLFIAPGRYVLQGRYMTSRLRMEQGLAWAVRCTGATKEVAGRSEPLQDTAGVWENFRVEFDMAADCGMAASLQLETFAPFEAAAGFSGRASFDRFELRPLAP